MENRKARTRREFLRDFGLVTGGATLATGLGLKGAAAADPPPDLVVTTGQNPKANVRKAIEALGGMKKFVSRGDVVVVKPNIGWDRLPRQAANTNPDVVAVLIEMAFDAGAKKVKVFDNSVNNPKGTYQRSGILSAAKAAGADVDYVDDRFYVDVQFKNTKFLKTWKVYKEAIECDCLINAPIAKHHSVARLTMAMKNHMGIIGGERAHWHRELDYALSEFTAYIKPQTKLTVLDAYRILTRNGPTGGSMRDVQMARKCIVGIDQVAVDAYGTTLFKTPQGTPMKPADLPYLVRARELGVGETDLGKLKIQQIQVA